MVGMRSCASGVARPKKGAKVRNVEASKKEPQPRKCKSAYAERQEEASSRAAPDARERIPTGAGDETVGPIISPMHTNGGLIVSSLFRTLLGQECLGILALPAGQVATTNCVKNNPANTYDC